MNAKNRIVRRNTTAKAFAIAAVTALALTVAPIAKADSKGCSNATLKGAFADKDTGFITAPPASAGPFSGVNREIFDGNGVLTTAGIASLNGNMVAVTGKGTYTVNPDCTGTYTVQISPLRLTTHAFFVIDDRGNELQIIVTDPGTVITCIARRQYPRGDWRQ
jgi:hypothetical protein